MSGSRHDLLMKGLVGDRLDLYLNNIRFYTAVNTLAEWLPILVDGLAVRAEADAVRPNPDEETR